MLPYSLEIPSYRTHSFVTYYTIVVDDRKAQWKFSRSYRELRALKERLAREFSEARTDFPPSKCCGTRNAEFIEARKARLLDYLRRMVQNRSICTSAVFQEFIIPEDRKITNN